MLDVRIFHKQLKTLHQAGYDIFFVVQNYKNVQKEGIKIIGLPEPKNRINRILFLPIHAFFKSWKIQASIYHVHDPELAPVLALLKILTGRFCIYDVHENYVAAIRDRFWIPKVIKKWTALTFSIVEKISVPFFDKIITVSPEISELYPGKSTTVIENFQVPGITMTFCRLKRNKRSSCSPVV